MPRHPSAGVPSVRHLFGALALAAMTAVVACDDSSVDPPTSRKITLQLTADVGGGEPGRTIAVRAYYLRNVTEEVELDAEPAAFSVSATTVTGTVSVEVLPCIRDGNREGAGDGAGRCRVHLEAELRASNGMPVSEDETVVMVTPAAASLTLEPFTLPSGALVPSSASVELVPAESGQLPAAVTVEIATSGPLQPGALSTAIEYVHGTGWLSAVIPAGQSDVTIVPTTAALTPGRYEAIVRITSAWMFTPTEIRVAYQVPHPPKTVTITGAGNGAGLILVTPSNATCTTSAGQLSGFCTVPVAHGSTITLTPTPAVGSGFTGWSGACQGTAPCSLIMDQHRTVTATFTILEHDLTVDAAGSGSGTITSAPAGISCTAAAGAESGTCSAPFDHPTQVTLTAMPNSATSAFTGWSGACQGAGACVVSMTEARSVTATFALISRQLTVTMTGGGTGTVTSTPAGVGCTMTSGQITGACSADFGHGTTVVLTAVPDVDMTFIGWSGACTGTGTCTVTMDAARSVTATIASRQLTVSMTGGGAGTVTSSPAGIDCTTIRELGPIIDPAVPRAIITRQVGTCTAGFAQGAAVVLTVAPGADMTFDGWGGACTGTEPTCSVTVDAARTVTATIVPVSVPLTITWSSNTSAASLSFSSASTTGSCFGPCIAHFPAGTPVLITAAKGGFQGGYASLTGDCSSGSGLTVSCEVIMNGPKTVHATFYTPSTIITVVGAGTGSGVVISSPGGINCTVIAGQVSGGCRWDRFGMTNVALTALPAPGSTLSGWLGCSPSGTTCYVSSLSVATVTATFDLLPPAQDAGAQPASDPPPGKSPD